MGKEKSNKKSVVKIVLGIVFFPITVYILIWKSKLSKKVKIILTVIWSAIFLAASAGSSSDKEKSDNKDNTSVVETVTTTEQVKETSAPETEVTTEETTVSEAEDVTTITVEETESATDSIDGSQPKILNGKLISVIENTINDKNIVVVKTKITPSYSNSATIHQNYFNVEDLIKNQGFDSYDEIQYWAVADMTDGSESKVISFTLNQTMIYNIKNEIIPSIYDYEDYFEDFWVLPSLKN